MRNGQNTRLVSGDRTGVSGDDGGTRQVVDRGDSDGDGLSLNRVLVAVVDLVGNLGVVTVDVVVLVETRSESKSREQSADRVPVSSANVELESTSREGADDRADSNLVARQISQRSSGGQLQSSDDGLQLIKLDVTTAQPNVDGLSKVGESGTVVFQESAVREARGGSEVVVGQIRVLDDDRGVIDSAEEDLDGLGPRSQHSAFVLFATVVRAASGFLDVVSEERLREQHRGLVLGVRVQPTNVDGAVINNAIIGLDLDGTSKVTGQNGRAVLVQLATSNFLTRGQNIVGKLGDVGIGRVTLTVEELEVQFNRNVFITNGGGHLGPRSVVDTDNVNTNDDVVRPGASVTDAVGEFIELVVTVVRGIRRSEVDDTSLRIGDESGGGGDELGRLGASRVELVETADNRGSENFGQNGINSVGGNTSQAEDSTIELVVDIEVIFSELDVADGSKRRVVQHVGNSGSTKTRSDQGGSLGLGRFSSERNAEASTHVGGQTSDALGELVDDVTFRGKIGDQGNLRGSQVDGLGDSEGQITAVGLNGDDDTEAQVVSNDGFPSSLDVRSGQEDRQSAEVEQGLTQFGGSRSESSAEDGELIDVDGDHTTSVDSPVETERRVGQGGKSGGSSVVVSVSQRNGVDPRAENVGGNARSINEGRDEGELVVVDRVVGTQREAQVGEQTEDVGQATKVNEPVGSVVGVGQARGTQNQGHIPLDGFLVAHGNEQIDVQIVDSADGQVSSVGVGVDRVAEASSQTTSNKGVSAELPVLASSGSRARGTSEEALAAGSAPTALRLGSAGFAVIFNSAIIDAVTSSQSEVTVNSQNVELSAERVGTNGDLTNARVTGDLNGQSAGNRSIDVLEDDTVGAEGLPGERDDGVGTSGLNVNTSSLRSSISVPSGGGGNSEGVRTTVRVGGVVGDEQVVGEDGLRSFDLGEVDQDAIFSVPSVPEGEEIRFGNSADDASLEDPRGKREFVAVVNTEARELSGTSAVGANIATGAGATSGSASTVTRARVGALSASRASGNGLTTLSGKNFSQAASAVVVDVGNDRNVARSANVKDAIIVGSREGILVDSGSASGFSLRLEDSAKSSGQVVARIEVARRNLTGFRQRSSVVEEQELVLGDTLILISAKAANTESLASKSVVDVDVGESTTAAQAMQVSPQVTSSRNFDEDISALEVVTSTAVANTRTDGEIGVGSSEELLDEEGALFADEEDIVVSADGEGIVDGSTANVRFAALSQFPATNRSVESSDDEVVAARSQLPVTDNMRRIEVDAALTGHMDGNVRITSRSANAVDSTSILNNPEGVVGKRSNVEVVGDLTSITNRGRSDTFNEGEVNDQTGRVVQIHGGGDEGSESLDVGERTSQIPNSEVVNNTVELLRTLVAAQGFAVLASADEDTSAKVSSQGAGSSSINDDSSVSVGSNRGR